MTGVQTCALPIYPKKKFTYVSREMGYPRANFSVGVFGACNLFTPVPRFFVWRLDLAIGLCGAMGLCFGLLVMAWTCYQCAGHGAVFTLLACSWLGGYRKYEEGIKYLVS